MRYFYFSLVFIIIVAISSIFAQNTRQFLFSDDFDDGYDDRWDLEQPWWSIMRDGSYILKGEGSDHSAIPYISILKNYSLSFKLNLKSGGMKLKFHTRSFYESESEGFYYQLAITNNQIELSKSGESISSQLCQIPSNTWMQFILNCMDSTFEVMIDSNRVFIYTDKEEPYRYGRFMFSLMNESLVEIDDILVYGEAPGQNTSQWIRTGGPSGGLGYDVRISPMDRNVIFVTDDPSGVNKSVDGGLTWKPQNTGIIGETNVTGGMPIFSLTIDPNNPNIIWAGFKDKLGLFKSENNGESWVKKVNGIALETTSDLTIRGIGIHPFCSDTLFVGCELGTGNAEFDKSRGLIFRSYDQGENWEKVWDGSALARFVLFDHHNPRTVYASTGIFDRNPEPEDSLGVGLLKSIDGGDTWFRINHGIINLFTGYLVIHPIDPNILYAASGGQNDWLKKRYNLEHDAAGGIFRTTNGGASWDTLLLGYEFTVVDCAPSNPNIIYAGCSQAIFRSDDNGQTWNKFYTIEMSDGRTGWGPPGIRAGNPIGIAIDPDDPMRIFINNYQGGNFLSANGGLTWVNSSKGYAGVATYDLAIDPVNPANIYWVGRGSPCYSRNGGEDWYGMAYPPVFDVEWMLVRVNPHNPDEIIMSNQGGIIYQSHDRGGNWEVSLERRGAGFTALAFAPSAPGIIYAGLYKQGDLDFGFFKTIDGGDSWRQILTVPDALQSILYLEVSPTHADSVWAATRGDGIWFSSDGGETWQAKNSGLGGSYVACLAIDPANSQILYAGLGEGMGIYKSVNSGNSWKGVNTTLNLKCPSYLSPIGQHRGFSLAKPPATPISALKHQRKTYNPGTPWTHISSIAINPVNSNEIYASDYEGGVWVSLDGGENWQQNTLGLNNHRVEKLAISGDGNILYAGTIGSGVFRLTKSNIPPEILSLTPAKDSLVQVLKNDTLVLAVDAYDLNGDMLDFFWRFNQNPLSDTTSFLYLYTENYNAGTHEVKVGITDRTDTVYADWQVKIEDPAAIRQIPGDFGAEYVVFPASPNPFDKFTQLSFHNNSPVVVTVEIFNILGEKVYERVYPLLNVGYHYFIWDGKNMRGIPVGSGIYMCRFQFASNDRLREIRSQKISLFR